MEPGEAAVPPRTTTSGRRYKALMPWRFQRGFVRKPYKGPTAAGAASAAPRGVKVGGSSANGSRSAPVGGGGAGVGDPVGGQVKKRGRPFGPGKGPDGKKMKMETDARCAGMDSQSMGRSTRSATMKSRLNGEKSVNSARCGAEEEDIQSKRSTRSETAKSYKEVKMENNSPQSGAEEDIQSKRSTRSETVNSSRRDETDNGAHSGARKDCQLKRGTGSVTMKTSNGEKTEKSARSGADKDCQLKRGTDSVTMKGSNGEKTEKSAGGGAGKDCQLKRGTDSVTMKSSNGEKTEKSAGSGAGKDCQLKRGTDSVAMKSSNGEKTEKSAGSGAGKDCQLKRGTDSVTMKSSNGEKTEKSARSGADKECGLGKSKSKSSGNIVGDGLAAAAGGDCDLGGSDCNRVARDKHNQNFETGSSIGAGDGAACAPEGNEGNLGAENCVSEGSKKSCVNRSGLKSKKSSATDHVLEEPAGKGGSTGDGASKESDVAAKGCSSAVPGSNGIGTNCRRGWKAIMPWRFQIGYKRSFSKAFGSNTGSVETPEYRAQGSSTQSTPGTRSTVRCYASPLSNVRISAMQDFSSGKGEKKTQTACKKVKTEKDDHNQGMPVNGAALARENVMRSLSDFRLIYKNLLVKLEDRSKEGGTDLQAYKIFREKYLAECNDMTYVGNVPGIHVGDIFHARVEISVVGLHRPHRKGIDYVKNEDGTCIAVSIVAYARLADVKNNLDAFIYSGSMKATLNQKIEGNNRALKKSMETKTPVRVIHGFGTHPQGNSQRKNVLIYGGLYLVEKYWREKESEDRYVYLFRMRRISGQKHINIEKILKLAQAEPFDGVIMKDISQGLERIPIPVVNSISSEHPMTYHYMSRLKYPPNYQPAPPAGCGCVGGCSDSKPCACAVKNGGEIPFNDNGRIIVAKPLVYECGPSCKCPPTCHNRVGQKGIKFRLQVFKTKSMGWGVKTLDFIPSGSFVCEYIGEVLDDEEAQRRMNDEYLFAIGHNYYDETLWEGLSRSIPSLQSGPPKDEEAGFAVDASKMGNFAKFINHSCSPNLYAQNVLYDHDDKSAPHIMFFACEDIPAHQELAYHYNYAIDQVHDADGNIKKKKCLCGSPECDGWLY